MLHGEVSVADAVVELGTHASLVEVYLQTWCARPPHNAAGQVRRRYGEASSCHFAAAAPGPSNDNSGSSTR